MVTAQECRRLADQCRQWASAAANGVIQEVFLAMAEDLVAAAARAEGAGTHLNITSSTVSTEIK
jgi:hypothetical protein